VLSSIIRKHPAALSISELFSALLGKDLTERELGGAEFWRMLSMPGQADAEVMLRCGISPHEVLYPVFDPRPGALRFCWTSEIPPPPLAQVTIPHLTSRADELYAMLEALTPNQPKKLLSEHFLWLFDKLAGERRPAVVVERSGGSLAYSATLLRLFPQAKVVHLFRDGRDCAVSMSRHACFKLAVVRAELSAKLGYDPYESAGSGDSCRRPLRDVDDELAGLMPDRITRDRFDRFQVPLARYGAMWSKMIAFGLAGLPDRSQVLAIDYDNLVSKPRESIGEFLEFLGIGRDASWEGQMADRIRGGRNTRAEVTEAQWADLTRACRLGMNRLYGRGCWT
jgi:hypothetical protein